MDASFIMMPIARRPTDAANASGQFLAAIRSEYLNVAPAGHA
jgi:hypothetical protein